MTIPEPPPASLRLRIDREALATNWRTLDSLSGTASAGAAVKAEAYGLGIDECIPALLEAGAREFFVAHWSEARDLLRFVPAKNIAVLHGAGNREETEFAIQTGVRPVVNSLHQAQVWKEAGGGQCHVMLDTGINRLGVSAADLASDLCTSLDIDILMSHLASADEDSAKNAAQLAAFKSALGIRKAKRYSLANSAGIALGKDYAFDLTRPGLALYGGIPRDELAGSIRQVVFPEAAVLQVRQLEPGDTVGYNATYSANSSMTAATVSIGYADGFLRCRGAVSALHKDGIAYPVIGRVSMDMVVVDCSNGELTEGDFLSIPFDLREVAEKSGLSQYELLTTLGHRFNRTF